MAAKRRWTVYLAQDKQRQADAVFRRAWRLLGGLGDQQERVSLLHNIGLTLLRNGDVDRGEACLREGLELATRLRDGGRQADIHHRLAELHRAQRQSHHNDGHT